MDAEKLSQLTPNVIGDAAGAVGLLLAYIGDQSKVYTTMDELGPSTVKEIANKHIDGFGELFRQVSFEKIGTSAIQSRAVAALINSTYVFCLPGSTGACKDGWDEILQYQLDIRHKPCNFVEIMPRLNEK